MLGTRTKQVFSYGRRTKRIVNVSEDREVETPWRSVSTKNSENMILVSPLKKIKPKRKSSHSASPPSLKKKVLPRTRTVRNSNKALIKTITSPRTPLNVFSPNVPPSSGVTQAKIRRSKPRISSGIGAPFSLLVDMDIIVLDDKGRKISQERRVGRTDVQANKGKAIFKNEIVDLCNSDEEEAVRPSKRRARPLIISDDEEEVLLPLSAPKAKESTRSKPVKTPSTLLVLPTVKSKPKPLQSKASVIEMPSPSHALPAPIPISRDFPTTYCPSSPVTRARQLTPIRRSSKPNIFQRGYTIAMSPTTPSDISLSDLSFDIDLEDADVTERVPEHLKDLLAECEQERPHEFSAFIETFPFDPLVDSAVGLDPGSVKFQKIGEASYSEVFGIGDVVLKVIPLRSPDTSCSFSAKGVEKETPPASDAKDVWKEMIVTRAMGQVDDGFVMLLRGYIVRGRYPSLLLDLWDEYAAEKGSEGVRPDTFNVSQVYAIIVLPNGGPDLEAYTFDKPGKMVWRKACSLFWQVVRSLEKAEELVEFEHRDLHWGQILIKNTSILGPPSPNTRGNTKLPLDDVRHGVKATIIDLGLSRMNADESGQRKVYWTPIDEEVFEGEGDYQFEAYRIMREWSGGKWRDYRPFSNVVWLHYLSLKLLHSKRLKPPSSAKSSKPLPHKQLSSSSWTEKECYECLVEVEAILGAYVQACRAKMEKKRARKAGKSKDITIPMGSAGEVRRWGIERRWVR